MKYFGLQGPGDCGSTDTKLYRYLSPMLQMSQPDQLGQSNVTTARSKEPLQYQTR